MRSWTHFSAAELACRCGQCDGGDMMDDFMERLERVRAAINIPLIVSSGYRCPEHNSAVSRTGRLGPHTTGRAIDITVAGLDAWNLLALAMQFGMRGIGVHQKGDWGRRFLHLDDLPDGHHPRPRLWSY